MILYIALALTIAICAELSVKLKSKLLRVVNIIIIIVLPSFLFAVRYDIGTDYYNYLAIYNRAKDNIESRIEWGYYAINSVVASLGGSAQVAFFIIGLIMFSFLYLAIRHYNNILSPGLAMFVFMLMYYQMSFNTIRQVITMTIVLYSIRFIQERKLFKFLFIIFIASSFHNSAWIFLPIYFLYPFIKKQKKVFARVLVYGSIVLIIIGLDTILAPVLSNVESLDYYLRYLDEGDMGTSLGFVIRSLPFIIIGIYLSPRLRSNTYFTWFFFLYIISILMKFTHIVGANYISRVAWNFEVILVLLVPLYIRELNKKREFLVSWLLICYIVIHWWYIYIYAGSHETVPYQWIFNQ
ncbi:EpsG family protein [Thalassorhabdus alkalitolerans]|uniref:EpsG family protein n=1 Tax=Thalassorhabdus alkalitolerans TaxID=2282697 RepID=A0ABW0YJ15_9BACI